MSERETSEQYFARMAAWSRANPGKIHPERLDRFGFEEGDATAVRPNQCGRCRHLFSAELWTCAAFPAGIPAAILTNEFDHRKPYLGDGGIRYEPLPAGQTAGLRRDPTEVAPGLLEAANALRREDP